MNKELFLKYIENPNALSNESLLELKQIIDDYPYFQTAQILYAKNLHNIKDIKFDEQLKIASTYINNRERLFYLINGTNEISEIENKLKIDDEIKVAEEITIQIEENLENSFVEQIVEEKIEIEAEKVFDEIIEPEISKSDIQIEEELKTETKKSIADEILERVQRINEIRNNSQEHIREIEIENEIVEETEPESEKFEPKIEFSLELVWNIDSVIELLSTNIQISENIEVIDEPIKISLNVVWNIDSVINLLPKESEKIIIDLINIDEIVNISEFIWNIDSLIDLLSTNIEISEIVEQIEISLNLVWNIDSLVRLLPTENVKVLINIDEILNISEFLWNIDSIIPEEIIADNTIKEILENTYFIVQLTEKTINLAKENIKIRIRKYRIRFEEIYDQIPLNWIIFEKHSIKQNSDINLNSILNSTKLQWELKELKNIEIELKKENETQKNDEISEFSFTDWLKIVTKKEISKPIEITKNTAQKASKRKTDMALIDKFIEQDPKISPKLESTFKSNEIIIQNSIDNEHFITETLADIYIKQQHFDKAINVYQKLSLKNPENYVYFAIKIEEVQNLINQQKNI